MSALAGENGPLETHEWPSKLTARVVLPGPAPALHGYDVEGDLAQHYTYAETMLLALTGDPPSPGTGRAFEIAMVFASPIAIVEAPAHAALVTRTLASSMSQMLGVTAIALGEQTRVLVERHARWIAGLAAPPAELPEECRATGADDRAAVARLRAALRDTLHVPVLELDLSRDAAVLAVLHACGLRTAERIECAIASARLPVALAEALAARPGAHTDYPVHLPAIVYEEDPS